MLDQVRVRVNIRYGSSAEEVKKEIIELVNRKDKRG